jgi:hypothetical protein
MQPVPNPRGARLPKSYENAFQELRAVLIRLRDIAMELLHSGICGSPQLRECEELCIQGYKNLIYVLFPSVFDILSLDTSWCKYGISLPKSKEYGVILLSKILIYKETHLWPLARLYDELDRLPRNQQDRISPLLKNILAKLGSTNDLLEMIDMHRPKIRHESKDEIAARLKRLDPLLGGFNVCQAGYFDIRHLAYPTSKFLYPKGPRTDEWATRCERVDNAMEEFWLKADRHIEEFWGAELFGLEQAVVLPHLSKQVVWADLGAMDILMLIVSALTWLFSVVRPNVQSTQQALNTSYLPFGVAEETTVPENPPLAKVKEKTKKTLTTTEVNAGHDAETNLPARAPIFLTSARACNVFSILFNASVKLALFSTLK